MGRSSYRNRGRKVRKGFAGVQYHVLKRQQGENVDARQWTPPKTPEPTASARKRGMASVPQSKPTPSNSCGEDGTGLPEYLIIERGVLTDIISDAHSCPEGGDISIRDERRDGLCSQIHLMCSKCGWENTSRTSKNVPGPGQCADMNRNLLAMEVALGRQGMADCMTILGTAPPISDPAFQLHVDRFKEKSEGTLETQMAEAAGKLREQMVDNDPTVTKDSVIDVNA